MNASRAWVMRLGSAHAAAWAMFVASLRQQNVFLTEETSDVGMPGLLLLDAVNDEVVAEIEIRARQNVSPILAVVHRRSDLGRAGAWRLVSAGVADVVVIDECPVPIEAVSARLQRIVEVEELASAPVVEQGLIGTSRVWRQAIRQAIEIARFSTGSLLITGESGTGKELVARLVHMLDQRHEKGRLIILDCTTIVPELSGSEFFGHERGAFTNAIASRDGAFAMAHKGSLFLDEVGELPLRLQAELLRVVQEHTYKRVGSNTWHQTDFRLVCATNRDLEAEEARGNFRLDFFHRIASSRCHMPSLRERRDDILPLARYFLREEVHGSEEVDFAPDVQELLLTRDYPGNVRELRQLVLRIARRHVGPGPVTAGAVPDDDRSSAANTLSKDWRDESFQNAIRRALAAGVGLQDIKDQTVETAIEIALHEAFGNNRRAALKLGVTDRALQMRRASRRDVDRGSMPSSAIERVEASTDREIRPPPKPSAS